MTFKWDLQCVLGEFYRHRLRIQDDMSQPASWFVGIRLRGLRVYGRSSTMTSEAKGRINSIAAKRTDQENPKPPQVLDPKPSVLP